MAVVAGLFDSEASATEAMDRLLREGIEDLETHVYSGGGGNDVAGPNVVYPVMPSTTGTPSGIGQASVPITGGMIGGDFDWFNDMDEVERAFYHEGIREGATLALAKVDDDDAHRVRQIFQTFNARTYTKD
jgi:hypothetical protein